MQLPGAGWVRATLVECARNVLPPDEPEVLRALSGVLWRVEKAIRPRRAEAFVEAAARLFAMHDRAAERLAREGHDADLQRRLEELVLGRVEPAWLDRYLDVSGLVPDDPPACFLALAAPHPLAGVCALARARPGLTAIHPALPPIPGATWADRWLRNRFTELRMRVPVLWSDTAAAAAPALAEGRDVHAVLTRSLGEAPVTDVERAIEGGRVVGETLPDFLASLAPAPVRLVLVHRERDKRWRIEITAAVKLEEIVPRLAAHVRRWPGQHLPWLAARVDGGDAPH